MTGHVFVFQGDLSRLACDAAVLACDEGLNITKVWKSLIPAVLTPGDRPEWLRLSANDIEGFVVRLPDSGKRRIRAVITTPTTSAPTPELVAERIVLGIRSAATELVAQDGRDLPLVAVPLVGTGAGGLRHRRGEVIKVLLPRLREAAQDCDIALVLWDARDVAAVQQLRQGAQDWAELPDLLRTEADRLGVLAGNGQLSLFIGAGVSKPVGLPDWWTLLKGLASDAGISGVDWDNANTDPIEIATPIVHKLDDRFHEAVANRLNSTQHGIGHGLLANLKVRQMVTSNFDPCMELAMDRPFAGEYRVLTRRLADSSKPWLLKLHGDINRRGSLVLSGAQYEDHEKEYTALRGVVEGLMLTSHLLFVGFSMTDRSFLRMANAVARVRQDAVDETGPDLPKAGTALALTEAHAKNTKGLTNELDFIPMSRVGDEKSAARLLEIFLDRLAWAAARTHELSADYLLDERYDSSLSASDVALRDALKEFEQHLPDIALVSPGWPTVRAALYKLGADTSR